MSFDTRGLLNDGMTPRRPLVVFMVAPFIALPLSACSARGLVRLGSRALVNADWYYVLALLARIGSQRSCSIS
jgi:hypothetical protein